VDKSQKANKKPLEHVAIIMDGNGRWAKQRNRPRIEGHRAGVQNLQRILKAIKQEKVPYLTVYSFSTENWLRPEDEISGLMKLLDFFLKKYTRDLVENGVRLRVIGDYKKLPRFVVEHLDRVIEKTKAFTDYNLTLALNYSSRHEIVSAIKRCVTKFKDKGVDSLDWNDLKQFLDTKELPDPDLIIRTSGESRLSNFMLLQAAYAEIYFTPILWPDFNEENLRDAIKFYYEKERRFGMTSEQINEQIMTGTVLKQQKP